MVDEELYLQAVKTLTELEDDEKPFECLTRCTDTRASPISRRASLCSSRTSRGVSQTGRSSRRTGTPSTTTTPACISCILPRRHEDSQESDNRLAARVRDLEQDVPRQLDAVRGDLRAHVTTQISAAQADYRLLRVGGAIALGLGFICTTVANFRLVNGAPMDSSEGSWPHVGTSRLGGAWGGLHFGLPRIEIGPHLPPENYRTAGNSLSLCGPLTGDSTIFSRVLYQLSYPAGQSA